MMVPAIATTRRPHEPDQSSFQYERLLLIAPVDLNPGYQGWLPQEAWDWIEQYKSHS